MEVVLSPKYQIVIPRQVRENLGLKKGQRFAVIVKNGVISLVPVPSLQELRGMASRLPTCHYQQVYHNVSIDIYYRRYLDG